MGMFFQTGENKIRPGVYQRYETIGTAPTAGAVNGICAATYRGSWGPLDQVVHFGSAYEAAETIGEGGTAACITELFRGGAVTVHAVRLGTGGQKATAILKDTAVTAANAITITTKYESARPFSYSIRAVLGDALTHEFVLIEDTKTLEKLQFPQGANEVTTLISLINQKSNYLTAEKVSGYAENGTLALVTQTHMAGGSDPTVTNEAYTTAFSLLESYRWNTISVDTDDTAVHLLLAAYMKRVYATGKMGFAIVGAPSSVPLSDRMKQAKAFNDYTIVYVGGGWRDAAGMEYNGWKAAARIAGMIASVSSAESLTHRPMQGATEPLEVLTNTQYEDATRSGMLTFSTSGGGVTWIENAITALSTPTGEDDAGWKKIKRAKVRYELMNRINDTIEPTIGTIINNSDGRANMIKMVKTILLSMVSESKLLQDPEPEVFLDPDHPPLGDSAWFIVRADDADAVEKAYFTFRFRYSPNAA